MASSKAKLYTKDIVIVGWLGELFARVLVNPHDGLSAVNPPLGRLVITAVQKWAIVLLSGSPLSEF